MRHHAIALCAFLCALAAPASDATVTRVTVLVPDGSCDVPAYSITADHAHVALAVTHVESLGQMCSNTDIL